MDVKPHEFPTGDIVRISESRPQHPMPRSDVYGFYDCIGIIIKRYLDFEGHIAVIQFSNGQLRINLNYHGHVIEKL